MPWLSSTCSLIEIEQISGDSCIAVMNLPEKVVSHPQNFVDAVHTVVDGSILSVYVREDLIGPVEDASRQMYVHYAYTLSGQRKWETPSTDVEMAKTEKGSNIREAQIPIDYRFAGAMFVIKTASTWVKDDQGLDFFAPFSTRTESFVVQDGTLFVSACGRSIHFYWDPQPSVETPALVHYGIAEQTEGSWSSPSVDVAFSKNGTASVIVPSNACGLSFVLRMKSGNWVKRYDGENFYISTRERAECETEAYMEFPLITGIEVKRVLALRRLKPFWTYPMVTTTLTAVPEETQFFVAELEDGRFSVFVSMVDARRGTRASFRGWSGGRGIVVRIESGGDQFLKPSASIAVRK